MAFSRLVAEYQRQRRIKDPKQYDNGSYQLIKLMGVQWWIDHGFHREYEVGGNKSNMGYLIDMANPRLKWAIEADGDKYHMDVVKELDREDYLKNRGWYIQRFRWADLVNRPDECKRDIMETWNLRRPLTKKEHEQLLKITREQMQRGDHAGR